MNSFEKKFFLRYLPEETEIYEVIHRHMILIIEKLFVWLSLFVAIPSFLYYQSYRLKEMIPFYFFETFLLLIFIKVIYDIFDWYNDVWVISNKGIYDIKWKLFKTEVNSINYENIEGVESEQNGIIDMILNKGDIVIHKIGTDVFRIKDVSKPFVAINEIERFTMYEEEKEENEDRFEMIIEALSGVVGNYFDKNGREKKDSEKEMLLEKIKCEEETIDLR